MRLTMLLLALIISTVGIIAGALGPGLEGGVRILPFTLALWAPVGFLILIKRPGNGVGAAALVCGMSWGAQWGLLTMSVILSTGHGAAWANLGNALFAIPAWLAIVWLLLVYPSGDYPTKTDRVTGRVLLGFGLIVATAIVVDPTAMPETGLGSPLGVPAVETLAQAISGEQSFMVFLVIVLWAIALVVARWRRSVGVERLQYQWLWMGATVFLVVIAVLQFLPGGNSEAWLLLVPVGGAAIPVAVGIAVLRYRLYEIDRIISRTVSYTVVVVVLVAVYVGGITWLTSLLPDQSQLVVAATTLAVAALSNPLRRRVQLWVDRRFNRSRYDTQRVMDGFAGSLRDQVDTEQVVNGWVDVVSETMQPSSVAVWVRQVTG